MSITAQQLAQVLYRAHKDDSKHMRSFMTKFYTFLEKNNRMGLLPHIVRHVRMIKEKEELGDTYEITSHEKLSASAVHDIFKKIQAPEGVRVIKNVDPEILGGIIIKHNGYIYDASIRAQLDTLRATLLA